MSKVILSHVAKTYRSRGGADVTGVHDVTIEIADHEFVVLAGPAGCGKTSVLRMIAGLEEVSRGEISLGEKRLHGVPPKDRDVAIVFGDDALYPHLTVYDNIAFGLRRRKFGEPEIQRRVNEAAAVLGLEQSLQRKPGALSRESRQRVALARAIARQPKLLLLDDPLANLDATTRVQMRAEVARLHQRLEATVIHATDNALEALTLGDKIVAMHEGVVQQIDTPRAIYEEPANLFVARFFGSPAMNLLNGILKQERDSLVFREANDGTVEARFATGAGARLSEFIGKPVILGVRPEDVELVPRPSGGEKSGDGFPAMVDLIEPLGAETHIHLQTGAHRLISRAGGSVDGAETGHRVRFKMNLSKAHLFDPISSQRLR